MTDVLATPKGNITIRCAVPEDAASVRELRLEALANNPTAFGADHAASAADSADVWAKRIAGYAEDNSAVISVAEVDGQLVGMVGFGRGHWPKTRHGGMVWGVYVRPDWRALGVAGALLEACAEWARANGVVVMRLGVATINTPAIRCYERCGFSIYATEAKAICHDGVYYDEFLMDRQL